MRNPPLFPAFVSQHSVTFDKDASDLGAQFPGIVLPDSLSRAVPKRKAEFLAGRFCVREVLRRIAPQHAEVPVGTGKNREPLWPEGIVGAITHTLDFASVAIAHARDARGIGLDAERPMTDENAEKLLDKIASPQEIAEMKRKTGWGTGVALTVTFSAKESVFKCLYPQVQRYFDFSDAWIEILDGERFSARLLSTLTPTLTAGRTFEGRFEHNDVSVCTGMVVTD
ncbi:4'-phosphopantetheinyl transferase superfamily protein [Pendulispora brunnea]|uniref:Enterobactin synthase component D n=1 Tax=Pendulispora brunnea TaxID=2905690 RepID=A0ABZ2KJC4_9BACT